MTDYSTMTTQNLLELIETECAGNMKVMKIIGELRMKIETRSNLWLQQLTNTPSTCDRTVQTKRSVGVSVGVSANMRTHRRSKAIQTEQILDTVFHSTPASHIQRNQEEFSDGLFTSQTSSIGQSMQNTSDVDCIPEYSYETPGMSERQLLNTGTVPSLNLNGAELKLEDDWSWDSPLHERTNQIANWKGVGDFTSSYASNINHQSEKDKQEHIKKAFPELLSSCADVSRNSRSLSPKQVYFNTDPEVSMITTECNHIVQNPPNCNDGMPENIQLGLENVYLLEHEGNLLPVFVNASQHNEEISDEEEMLENNTNPLRFESSTLNTNQLGLYSDISISNITVDDDLAQINEMRSVNEEEFDHISDPLRIETSTIDINQTVHNYSEKSYPASQNYCPNEEHNYFIFEDGLPKQCFVTTGIQKNISNQRGKGRGRANRKSRKKGSAETKCKDESEVLTSPLNNCDNGENVIEEQSIYFTNDIGDTGNEVLVSNVEHISSEEQDYSTAIWQIGDNGNWIQDEKSDLFLYGGEEGDNGQFEDCNDDRSVHVKIEEDINSECSDSSDQFSDESSSEDDGKKRNKSDDSWHPTSESEDEDEDVLLQEEERKKRYPTKKSRPKKKSRYQCEHCGEIVSKDKSTIQSHLFKSHGINSGLVKTFRCHICGKQFRAKKGLAYHLLRHSGERPFECCECGRKFASTTDMNNHKRYKHSTVPHVCSVCGRSFSAKRKLKRHSLIHTGHKPYLCNQCGMLFNQVFNLVVHIKSHDRGTLPLKNCRQCGREFPGSPEKLAAHIIEAHMTIYPYRCQKCGHVFKDENTLGCHVRQHRVTDVE